MIWRRDPKLFLVIVALAVLVAIFVVYPIGQVFWASLHNNGQLDFTNYRNLFTTPRLYEPVLNTLFLGVCTAIGSTVLGYYFAFVISRTNIFAKSFFRFVATAPLIAPTFILALSAIILLGKNGLITQTFFANSSFSIYGFFGLWLVQVLSFFPLAYLVCIGTLDTIDPSIEEASFNQMASAWQTFRKVTLPLSLPGIVSSLLLCFIESISDFAIPLILSGNFRVLSVEAYLKIIGAERDLAGGATLAICLLGPSLLAFFVQKFWIEKKSFATVTGKPSSARLKPLKSITKWLFTGNTALLTCFILGFYIMIFYGSVTEIWGVNHSLTLRHFVNTFHEAKDYIFKTVIISVIATPLTSILALFMAYLFVRKNFWGKTLLETATLLSFTVPGTVVGIGYILAFNGPPFYLQGTLAIIVLMQIFRNLPVGLRAGVASLKQIDPVIEEAAQNMGSGNRQVFAKIVLPLLRSAFFSGLTFSFIKCMTAISAVIFVVSGRWNLLTIAILNYVENGDLSSAAALSVILILCVMLFLALFKILLPKRKREFASLS